MLDSQNSEIERDIENTEREIARLSQQRAETARRQQEFEKIESRTGSPTRTQRSRDRKPNSTGKDFSR